MRLTSLYRTGGIYLDFSMFLLHPIHYNGVDNNIHNFLNENDSNTSFVDSENDRNQNRIAFFFPSSEVDFCSEKARDKTLSKDQKRRNLAAVFDKNNKETYEYTNKGHYLMTVEKPRNKVVACVLSMMDDRYHDLHVCMDTSSYEGTDCIQLALQQCYIQVHNIDDTKEDHCKTNVVTERQRSHYRKIYGLGLPKDIQYDLVEKNKKGKDSSKSSSRQLTTLNNIPRSKSNSRVYEILDQSDRPIYQGTELYHYSPSCSHNAKEVTNIDDDTYREIFESVEVDDRIDIKFNSLFALDKSRKTGEETFAAQKMSERDLSTEAIKPNSLSKKN